MARISKTWIACDAPSCEEEVLAHWAERTGWTLGSPSGDLCKVHSHRIPYAGFDVKERAAAEDVGGP